MSATVPLLEVWTLARLLVRLPVDLRAITPDHPLHGIIQRVANANGHGPRREFEAAVAGRDDEAEIVALVASIDPESPAPTAQGPTSTIVPELPDEARPSPSIAADAGDWLDKYVAYGMSVSPMTPRTFHESAGLSLGAAAIARRICVPMSYANVYPNLFVLWVAPTTIFHKSTAMDAAREIARQTFDHLLSPQEMTPEAFLADMAGMPPSRFESLSDFEQQAWKQERDFAGQRTLILDEASGLLSSAGRDY